MDPVRRPRIKFCGITSVEDAERCVALGAWALGLIFHEPSPRACDPAVAAAISRRLRRRVEICGVFVNEPLDELSLSADEIGLSLLQLHGDEGPLYCAEAARRTGAKVIKAVAPQTAAELAALRTFHTDYHLLDTHHAQLRGGTGETFDWALANDRRRGHTPLVLSGGLTAANVGEAIATAAPFAVDVASGVESAPGVKDPDKLAAFAQAVQDSAAPAEPATA